MTKTKFWKTTITFEVLTEHPERPLSDDMTMGDIVDLTINGHASGNVTHFESEEVTHKEMRHLLMHQNSDPDFLDPIWEDEDEEAV